VVEAYDFHQQQIASCDTELPQYLAKLPSRTPVGEARPAVQVEKPAKQRKKLKASRKSKDNRPHFDLGAELERLLGVHLRIIDGRPDDRTGDPCGAGAGPERLACGGTFCVLAGVIPAARRERWQSDQAGEATSEKPELPGSAASAIEGSFGGGIKAVKAMARYLACLIHRLLTKGPAWVDRGAAYCESQREERELPYLRRHAAAKGLKLVPVA